MTNWKSELDELEQLLREPCDSNDRMRARKILHDMNSRAAVAASGSPPSPEPESITIEAGEVPWSANHDRLLRELVEAVYRHCEREEGFDHRGAMWGVPYHLIEKFFPAGERASSGSTGAPATVDWREVLRLVGGEMRFANEDSRFVQVPDGESDEGSTVMGSDAFQAIVRNTAKALRLSAPLAQPTPEETP